MPYFSNFRPENNGSCFIVIVVGSPLTIVKCAEFAKRSGGSSDSIFNWKRAHIMKETAAKIPPVVILCNGFFNKFIFANRG
jgi:hypothetical protein